MAKRKYASPEKQAAHDEYVSKLYSDFKQIEKDLTSAHGSYGNAIADDLWKTAFRSWRIAWNTCPECQSTDTTVVDYSMMWGDGDVVCTKCGTYVRTFDAG